VPHNLLLADDSVTIQRVIKLTFADEDVDVVAVGDGDQAVAAIDKAPPDIVLADVAMPGRSGYDVAQHIRTTPRLAHIPVVLLTGAFEPVDEARALEVGCDGVLAKPFEPEVVVNRVRELLLRGHTVTPPAVAPPAPVIVPEPPAPAAPARSAVDIDAYFDRLDQAFANLGALPKSAPAPAPEEPAMPPFGTPVSAASDANAPDVSRGPSRPVHEPDMQSIVDSFEGMLVRGSSPATKATAAAVPVTEVEPVGPVPAGAAIDLPASTTGSLSFSDAQIDQIVSRVLDRLTARVAGGNLSEVVAQVAERLVRSEIDDIKRRL
jgi:CheY-like chemotaxis protein